MKKHTVGIWIYGICVALLTFTAVWQAASFLRLWTNRGRAYTNPNSVTEELDRETGLMRPIRIYASSGRREGRACLVNGQTAHYTAIYNASWNFLKAVLEQGAEAQKVSIERLNTIGVVCRYTYNLELSAEILSAETGWYYGSQFAFQELWMVPAQSVLSKACVYLVDFQSGTALRILAANLGWQEEVNQALADEVQAVCSALDELYLTTYSVYPGIFRENLYLRDQKEPEILVPWREVPIEWSETQAREYAERFSTHPELLREETYDSGSWVFTDDRVSIRVQKDGKVEYVATPAVNEAEGNLGEAYREAWNFLQEDLRQEEDVPETCLSRIEETPESTVFYMNYTVDDREVLPEAEDYAIRIEVKNGQVYRYQRRCIQVEYNSYGIRTVQDTALDVLNRQAGALPDTLQLVYRICSGEAELYWRLEYSGTQLYEKVRL